MRLLAAVAAAACVGTCPEPEISLLQLRRTVSERDAGSDTGATEAAPCADKKPAAWCAKRAEQGKCTKKKVQKLCARTCDLCNVDQDDSANGDDGTDTDGGTGADDGADADDGKADEEEDDVDCVDAKPAAWCAKRAEKCHRPSVQQQCAHTCDACLEEEGPADGAGTDAAGDGSAQDEQADETDTDDNNDGMADTDESVDDDEDVDADEGNDENAEEDESASADTEVQDDREPEYAAFEVVTTPSPQHRCQKPHEIFGRGKTKDLTEPECLKACLDAEWCKYVGRRDGGKCMGFTSCDAFKEEKRSWTIWKRRSD